MSPWVGPGVGEVPASLSLSRAGNVPEAHSLPLQLLLFKALHFRVRSWLNSRNLHVEWVSSCRR